MLKLRAICKKLGAMNMHQLDLTAEKGQYLVLLGPSGVGKTILLEIIAGLIKPDSGKISYDNTDITFAPPEARGFSIVYQDYALFPHLTVSGNIAYGLKAAKIGSTIRKERIHALAKMLNIDSILHRYPEKLSGGEQQRVALARALAIEPKLLLLDEPLSALDANTRSRLRKELRQLTQKLGTTVIHVTHDPEEAMALADKVAVMLDHQVKQIAKPVELFRRPSDAQVAAFLGMKNILPVTTVSENICRVCDRDVHANSADDSTSYLWIGPEEILLSKQPFDSSALNRFKCKVLGWEHYNTLLAVDLTAGEMKLTALITHTSFEQLNIEQGNDIYATFKSSAVHCF